MNSAVSSVSRRGFLGAGAGLVLGFYLPSRSRAEVGAESKIGAWVRIGSDDSITLMIHKTELGQGTVTALSQLLAEELECDWKKVHTEFPPVDRAYGAFQGVVGSASIRTSYDSLRKAGAAAREMLVSAAGAMGSLRRRRRSCSRLPVPRLRMRSSSGWLVSR
jgi:isoquinoline 1-oxidoreductase beta subunit